LLHLPLSVGITLTLRSAESFSRAAHLGVLVGIEVIRERCTSWGGPVFEDILQPVYQKIKED
jgi:hypothetical protein